MSKKLLRVVFLTYLAAATVLSPVQADGPPEPACPSPSDPVYTSCAVNHGFPQETQQGCMDACLAAGWPEENIFKCELCCCPLIIE